MVDTKVTSSVTVYPSSDNNPDRGSQIGPHDQNDDLEDPVNSSLKNKLKDWDTRRSLLTWLLICYSTGPTSSMAKTYVPAAIQSAANALGHQPGSTKPCLKKGGDCLVKFGAGEVRMNSYVLYLRAIFTAVEGVLTIFTSQLADYSNNKKKIMIGTIITFGIIALPFAGLKDKTYPVLRAMSALYILLNSIDAIYETLEGSYIPIFMRARVKSKGTVAEDVRRDIVLKRGSVVSVLGIFIGNVGGLTALLIGIIISYSRGFAYEKGYENFLLAITIAGCITIAFCIIGAFLIPSVKGLKKPPNTSYLKLSINRIFGLFRGIKNYPEAFKLCIAWVIWNVSYTNFLSVFALLFRSTLGLGTTDGEYTIYTFMSYIVASIGSLAWMFLYPRTRLGIKGWAYIFLSINLFTNFWGCLGISNNLTVGFKHRAEFWVFEIFFVSSSSALRSLNRVLYSTLLPEGNEAQYFGLEIFLGVATGWIGTLVIAVIQDRTGNDRYPFLPNLFLVMISAGIYFWVDAEKGMREAQKLVSKDSDEESEEED